MHLFHIAHIDIQSHAKGSWLFLPPAQEKETPVTYRNVFFISIRILPVLPLKIRKTDGSIHALPGHIRPQRVRSFRPWQEASQLHWQIVTLPSWWSIALTPFRLVEMTWGWLILRARVVCLTGEWRHKRFGNVFFCTKWLFVAGNRESVALEVNRFQAVNFPPVFNWRVWEGVFHPQAATKTLEPWDKVNRKHQAIQQPQLLWQIFPALTSSWCFLHGFQQQTFKKTHHDAPVSAISMCLSPNFQVRIFFVLPLEVKMMNSSLQAGLAKADDVLARGQQAVDGWGPWGLLVEMVVSPGWIIFFTYRSWWMNGEKLTKTLTKNYGVLSWILLLLSYDYL